MQSVICAFHSLLSMRINKNMRHFFHSLLHPPTVSPRSVSVSLVSLLFCSYNGRDPVSGEGGCEENFTVGQETTFQVKLFRVS